MTHILSKNAASARRALISTRTPFTVETARAFLHPHRQCHQPTEALGAGRVLRPILARAVHPARGCRFSGGRESV